MGIQLTVIVLIWWALAMFGKCYVGRVETLKAEDFTNTALIKKCYREVLLPSFKALLKLQMLAYVFATLNGIC